MNNPVHLYVLAYFAAVSVITSLAAIIDKKKAEKHKYRIPEATLIFLGFIGGAFAEYLTMKKIRHKTRHKKFMLGLPVIILIHILLTVFMHIYLH